MLRQVKIPCRSQLRFHLHKLQIGFRRLKVRGHPLNEVRGKYQGPHIHDDQESQREP